MRKSNDIMGVIYHIALSACGLVDTELISREMTIYKILKTHRCEAKLITGLIKKVPNQLKGGESRLKIGWSHADESKGTAHDSSSTWRK